MALYSVMLRRRRLMRPLGSYLQDFEMSGMGGKWHAILSRRVESLIAPEKLICYFENSRWKSIYGEPLPIPRRWQDYRDGSITLVREIDFVEEADIVDFIADIMLEDTEFYVMAKEENCVWPVGYGWYGVLEQRQVMFDEKGNIAEVLAERNL